MGGSQHGDLTGLATLRNSTDANGSGVDGTVRPLYGPVAGTATQRINNRSAAGASASVSISIPRTDKGSGGGASNSSKFFNRHFSSSSSYLPVTRRHLLCFVALLMLLPLGFLIKVHVIGSSSSSMLGSSVIPPAALIGSRPGSSTYSSSGRSRNAPQVGKRPNIDLDKFDLSRFTPLPRNYGEAKAYIMAAAQEALGVIQSSNSRGSSSSSTPGWCIPPDRALTWEQIDAEIAAESGPAAQQQAASSTNVAVTGRRRGILQQAAAAVASHEASVPLPAAAAEGSGLSSSSSSSDEYYDGDAVASPAADLSAVTVPNTAAAAAAPSATAAAAIGDLDHYYDAEAAAARTDESSAATLSPAAAVAEAAAPLAATDMIATGHPIAATAAAAGPAVDGATAVEHPAGATDAMTAEATTAAKDGPATAASEPEAAAIGSASPPAAPPAAAAGGGPAAPTTEPAAATSTTGTDAAPPSIAPTTAARGPATLNTDPAAVPVAAATPTAASTMSTTEPPAAAAAAGAADQPAVPGYKPQEPEQPSQTIQHSTAGTTPVAAGSSSLQTAADTATSHGGSSAADTTVTGTGTGALAAAAAAADGAAVSSAAAQTAAAGAAAVGAGSTDSGANTGSSSSSADSAALPATTDTAAAATTSSDGSAEADDEYEASYDNTPPAAATDPRPAAAAAAAVAPASIDQLQIALVNDVEFHHEVTLGLMSALQKHKGRLTVYVHDTLIKAKTGRSSSSGVFDFVSYVDKVMPGNTLKNAYYKPGITKTDVAIFVSPEFSIDYYREFIRRATPRLLLVFIHEPNMELRRLQYIINMHPLVGVAALSPHVAETVRTRMRMNHVHWMMPLLPVQCENSCWEGFAVQGKFEGSRRTYASLWQMMMQHSQQQQQSQAAAAKPARHLKALATSPAQSVTAYSAGSSNSRRLLANATALSLPRINVMGSGSLSGLSVPQELRPYVHMYKGLGYGEYFDTICRSVALLPLFNVSSGYLSHKVSSTVLASVATAVPMVVPDKFLQVYSVFKPEHVLVMDAGSDEVITMNSLSASTAAATLAAKRASLQQLRLVLNQQASAKLDGLLGSAIGRKHATTKQDR